MKYFVKVFCLYASIYFQLHFYQFHTLHFVIQFHFHTLILLSSDFRLQTSDLITFYVIRSHSFTEAMSETHESSILEYADRNIIDIMKENMISEKILNEDYITFLKDQIKAYMIELSHKNEQITSLIKLFEKNVNKTNMYVETMPKSSVRNVECDNNLQLIGNNIKVVTIMKG